ncbi:syntaxin 8 [Ophiocordyceps camponoti-floridani]|uniref:Syntaxin 8 n=1 Tax=Ophiocordyceps camponoti-floridani TaxID=2030778 RepID=A0A8H4Q3Q6_9HYPO|nr:syntaxin 8 [Ophiocordyceps camponoti-floridani]
MSKSNQLFLLADHIKLSLLERHRSKSLDLDCYSQDQHLTRSLDQFRDGLEILQQDKIRSEESGDTSVAESANKDLLVLQDRYDDLTSQFHGFSTPLSQTELRIKGPLEVTTPTATVSRKPKSVRFNDSCALASDQSFRPYQDDPSDHTANNDHISNQQLHDYQTQILDEQDEHLDQLGQSIGRQRELSMRIGDELDCHVAMLEGVEAVTDRHQSRLDRTSKALGRVAKGARENKQMTAIVVLIIILVLLIAILK